MRASSKGTIFFALATIGMVLESASCARTACLVVTRAEYDAKGCPPRDEALTRMGQCGTEVQELAGDGYYNGQTCCYPAVYGEARYDTCGGFEETIGTGGTGGEGGGFVCSRCGDVVFVGDPQTNICPEQEVTLSDLLACACSDCSGSCGPNLCIEQAMSNDCAACLMGACPALLESCSF